MINVQTSVVIIGAGMAGLSAVEHLIRNGMTNIVVLEAAKSKTVCTYTLHFRYGGRIHTVYFGRQNSIVELGANWIHGGSPANPVFNLVVQNGLLPGNINYYERDNCHFVTSSGSMVEREMSKTVYGLFQDLEKEMSHLEKCPTGTSVKEYINQREEDMVRTFKSDEGSLVHSMFSFLKKYLEFHIGDSLEKLSIQTMKNYKVFPGKHVKLPLGYKSLLDVIVYSLPEGVLKLNHEVFQLDWAGPKCKVFCLNDKVFEADNVILTVPLGVLKTKCTSMFNPSLPRKYLEVIERTGFGRVGKIFLEFEQPFWKAGTIKYLHIAWDKAEWEKMKIDPKQWIASVNGFEEVLNNPKVLVGWIAGPHSEYMEKVSDEEIKETCTLCLRRFLNKPSIPIPVRILRSKWCSDPLFGGSYSYLTLNNLPGDMDILATPLPSVTNLRLLFAGEATHPSYFSTTHGARLSGLREASRLVKNALKVKL
ncbi:spermine oxidase-like [Tachypleus tridentatus]|uniref:spermine oxidase-like n=1 Tax=Tachypleus tridentatus TaxID=6853 RepID=UPI003FD2F324